TTTEIVEAAIKKEPGERPGFLDQACADNREQRARLEAMLGAHFSQTQTVGDAPGETVLLPHGSTTSVTHQEGSGEEIGPYRLLEELGEGGMGTVFLAEQVHRIRRQVALKIVKAGMDTQTVIARFEAERQALAKMDHPNIARVLDAGTTAAGRPYFVMELVRGLPITDYANDHRLSPRERLQLMIPVCQAIQHAHQKRLIHRDIKPSTILVTEHDGKPVPKVTDFGIAKALEPSVVEDTMLTRIGTVVGTLEYMSPEQAEAGSRDIDTRSDIYSLGVLLYELLTGTTPLQLDRKVKAGLAEILRRIRDDNPPLPSARLTSSRETLMAVCAQLGTNPAKLPKLVRGELDWIVMKALEKDRTRRFETANGLARDLQRYLSGEPVEAGPPSATYRALKFAGKYRWPLTAAAAFAMLLAAGVVASTWQAVRARRAEQVAQVQRDRAVAAEERARTEQQAATRDRDLALTEKQRADTEAATARAVNEFVQSDLLAQASASQQFRQKLKPDPDLKVRTALDRAAAQIEGKFPGQPLVEASIRSTIAHTYAGLGLVKEAAHHFRRTLELRRKTLGEQHPETLQTIEELGQALMEEGNFAESERYLVQALQARRTTLGENHPATLSAKQNVAKLRSRQSRYPEALALLKEVIEARRKALGANHPETLDAEFELASVYRFNGSLREAETLQVKVFEARRKQLGEDHPQTLSVASDLAELDRLQGKYAAAESLTLNVAEAQLRVLGADHPDRLTTLNNLANLHFAQNKYAQAAALNSQVLEGQRRILGNEHPDTLNTMINLAICYRAQGKYDDAEALYLKVIEVQRRVLGEDHAFTLTATNNLGVIYSVQGKHKQAEETYARVLAVRIKKLGTEHLDTLNAMSNVGLACAAQERFAEAEALFVKALEGHRRAARQEHPAAIGVMQLLAAAYSSQGNYGEAESMLRECVRLREKVTPDSWERYHVAGNLGNVFLLQARFAEAERYLVDGYLGMMERYSQVSANNRATVALAGKRVVELYEKWGRAEKAAEWRLRIETGGAGRQ
ncbi:MAG: serine/threonine-protein kinase, partial [Candidatus Solibacter sp.]|nr:serine/threonine-protein kinase [Candidatus Solibacter sp.]